MSTVLLLLPLTGTEWDRLAEERPQLLLSQCMARSIWNSHFMNKLLMTTHKEGRLDDMRNLKNGLLVFMLLGTTFLPSVFADGNSGVRYPENVELFKTIGQPLHIPHDEWKALLDFVGNYPKPLTLNPSVSLITRVSSKAEDIFFADNDFNVMKSASLIDAHTNGIVFSQETDVINKQNVKVSTYVLMCKNNETTLANACYSARLSKLRFARPNESEMVSIRRAVTTWCFYGDRDQSFTWSIGNLTCRFHTFNETSDNYVGLTNLTIMANHLSALFDPPPATASKAKPETLQLTTSPNQPDTVRVSVLTPAGSPYADWWLRLDTTAGALSVTEPGKAILSNIPKEGATLTTYAISPDGKEWRYTTLEIPATKK